MLEGKMFERLRKVDRSLLLKSLPLAVAIGASMAGFVYLLWLMPKFVALGVVLLLGFAMLWGLAYSLLESKKLRDEATAQRVALEIERAAHRPPGGRP
jgi:hypothetical protein